MKINISRKELLNLISPFSSVVSQNSTMPILENIKLSFKDGKLFITGDNLRIRCVNSIDFIGANILTVCINFKMLLSILKTITDNEIGLTFIENSLSIKHKKGNYKLPTFSANEFPEIKKEMFVSHAKLNAVSFKDSLKVANRFVYNDDIDAMSNIYIELDKNVFIYSTDRNRLFKEQIKGKSDKGKIFINGKTTTALYNLIDTKDTIDISFNDSKLYLKFGNKEIFITQQNGDFPVKHFNLILGGIEKSKKIKLDVSEFIKALQRVSILGTTDNSNRVKLDIQKDNINLSCENIDFANSSKEDFPCKSKIKQTMAYNYKYLIEILTVFDNEPELMINKENGLLFIKQNNKIGGLARMTL